jgi:hypothetical protein
VIGLVVALGAVAFAGACIVFGPLWLALVAASLALFFFGGLVGRMILGRMILRPLIGRDPHPVLGLLIGIVALLLACLLLGFIPWVGWLMALVLRVTVVLTGVGALVQELRGLGDGGEDGAAA